MSVFELSETAKNGNRRAIWSIGGYVLDQSKSNGALRGTPYVFGSEDLLVLRAMWVTKNEQLLFVVCYILSVFNLLKLN